MVIGFDRFREAFQDFAENYIVIGGSAVGARRFVREFKKEYGDRIEDARKVKTEGDVLDAWLGWMDGARPAGLVRSLRRSEDGAVFTADRIRMWHL